MIPASAYGWNPGTYPESPLRMHSSGFTVDTQDRNDVLAFWHAVYQASEGYETRIAWTGNYSGNNGTISAAFVDDVERRVNYFRAMSGVPASVQLNSGATVRIDDGDTPYQPAASTLKSTAVQNSALMLIRNYNSTTGANPAFTHTPSNSVTGFSNSAWNGNNKSNLAFGSYGPGAVTAYMQEEISASSTSSVWNSNVGHRRWTLYPPSTDFATGDQPGTSAYQPPTNALYVTQKPEELATGLTPVFVAYPPAGFFPAQVNSRFWSLSRAGANFTNATVSVTTAGGAPVSINGAPKNNNSYGDPAIIWDVVGAADAKSVTSDTTYHVTVSGIAGAGVPTSHSYSVTLVNPNLLSSDQSLTGSPVPPAALSANYFYTPPPGTEGTEVTAFQPLSTAWNEGAQTGPPAPRVIDNTDANYELISNMGSYSSSYPGFGNIVGNRAFRLTFPVLYDLMDGGAPQQSFELDRDIVPKAGATLTFKFRRGYFTTSSKLAIEASANDGATWSQLGSTISGVSDSNYDGSYTSGSRNLALSATPLRIRFRIYALAGGAVFPHANYSSYPTGIFIDDITTTNCDWLEKKATTTLPASADRFTLDATSAGISLTGGLVMNLRMRTKLGGKWFHYGPVKPVTVAAVPLTGYAAWNAYEYPVVVSGFTGDDDGDGVNNGIEYAFSLDPLHPSAPQQTLTPNPGTGTLSLSQPLPVIRPDINYRGEWSADLTFWSETGVTVTTTGGQVIATSPPGAGARFMRWKIVQP